MQMKRINRPMPHLSAQVIVVNSIQCNIPGRSLHPCALMYYPNLLLATRGKVGALVSRGPWEPIRFHNPSILIFPLKCYHRLVIRNRNTNVIILPPPLAAKLPLQVTVLGECYRSRRKVTGKKKF